MPYYDMGLLKFSLLVGIVALVLQILPHYLTNRLPQEIHGSASKNFAAVETAFRENFALGWEAQGAAAAVYHKGKLVVDLWGGFADEPSMQPWNKDTMTLVNSATKAVSALCIAHLMDQGLLSYEDLVIKFWPEFGQSGKKNITVEMILNHQAGLPYTDVEITPQIVKNPAKMSKIFEGQKPHWPAGSATGYHPLTFGWLVDQIVRRVDTKQRSVAAYFKEEFAQKYDIDFHIGLPYSENYRVARHFHFSLREAISSTVANYRAGLFSLSLNYARKDSYWAKSVYPWLLSEGGRYGLNDPDIRALELPAVGGIGTARALAKLFSLVADGIILSKKTLDLLSKPQLVGKPDIVLFKVPIPKGHGFFYSPQPDKQGKLKWLMGHTGFGGQVVRVDLGNELSYAYITNGVKLGSGDTVRSIKNLQDAIFSCL